MSKSYLNLPNLPKGIRNNNPGNLRRLGKQLWNGEVPYTNSKDPDFSQFYELRYGMRAMMLNIINKIKAGHNTLSKLITIYAPPSENNTAAYIANVAAAIALAPTAIIDLSEETIIALTKAMIRIESGDTSHYIADSDYHEAIAVLGITLKKKA